MEYLKVFDTEEQYNAYANSDEYEVPNVSLVAGETVKYNIQQQHDYSKDYLTFNIISAGTINWKASDSYTATKTISYSTDSGSTWTDITSTSGGTVINVNTGDKVMFKGDNTAYGNYSNSKLRFNTFSDSTAKFNLEGNIMSLINSTGFTSATTLIGHAYAFPDLFKNCTVLTSAENLVLPATALTESCYNGMFMGCTSLTTAPELPATKLYTSCYQNMFCWCTSLTTVPELPATTLAKNCYRSMFQGCTSLTTAHELPATALTNYCYYYMFQGCTSLTTAPELPATTLANNCYMYMFDGCTSLTTAPELPATTLASSCYENMFAGCTLLTTAPELPATNLAYMCYREMFSGCTNLNYIKCLATDISANNCTYQWVNDVAHTGTFVKDPNMSNWTTGNNGIPTNWTVQDAS